MEKIGKKLSEVKVSRRTFLKGAIAGTAAMGAGSLLPRVARAQEKEPILVGITSPLSGNFGDMGAAERRGMEMAMNEFNAKGGVLGRKIEMLLEDTQTNPMVGSRKASRLIKREKVNFLMGEVSSAAAVAIGEVAQAEQTIYINCNGNTDSLTDEKCHRYTFRVAPSVTMFARAVATYLADNVGKKWYFFTHDYTGGHTSALAMRKILEAKGGTFLGETLIPMGTTDFSGQILKMQQAKPEVFIPNVFGTDAINLFKQLNEFGVTKEYGNRMGSILRDYLDCWASGPGIIPGYSCIEWYHDQPQVPGVADFIKRFQKTFPGSPIPIPENNGFTGYIGMKALLLAVEKAGTTDSKAVVKALEGLRYNEPANGSDVYIREWDHQFLTDFYLIRSKQPGEMKDKFDLLEVMAKLPGEKYPKSREESPCKMESL
jgi:branched-chain amino acid transport system substrate-binding protein